jgi:hypothetical protein
MSGEGSYSALEPETVHLEEAYQPEYLIIKGPKKKGRMSMKRGSDFIREERRKWISYTAVWTLTQSRPVLAKPNVKRDETFTF